MWQLPASVGVSFLWKVKKWQENGRERSGEGMEGDEWMDGGGTLFGSSKEVY